MSTGFEMWIVYDEEEKILGIYPDQETGMLAYSTTPEANSLVRYFEPMKADFETSESEEENE